MVDLIVSVPFVESIAGSTRITAEVADCPLAIGWSDGSQFDSALVGAEASESVAERRWLTSYLAQQLAALGVSAGDSAASLAAADQRLAIQTRAVPVLPPMIVF